MVSIQEFLLLISASNQPGLTQTQIVGQVRSQRNTQNLVHSSLMLGQVMPTPQERTIS